MKKSLVMVFSLVFCVALAIAPALAQEDELEPEAGGFEKVPSGNTVLYTFTGAVHDSDNDITTCVTCTYTGKKSTNVTVQFFDKDESFSDAAIPNDTPVEAVDSFTANSGNTTETFCVEQTFYYDSEELPPTTPADYIDQGFIRVFVTSREAKNIICDAVVLDSAHKPPNFIYPLNGERNKSKKYSTSK